MRKERKRGRKEWVEVSFDSLGCKRKEEVETYVPKDETEEEGHENVLVYDRLRV